MGQKKFGVQNFEVEGKIWGYSFLIYIKYTYAIGGGARDYIVRGQRLFGQSKFSFLLWSKALVLDFRPGPS